MKLGKILNSHILDIVLILLFLLPQGILLYLFVPLAYYMISDGKIKQLGFLGSYFTMLVVVVIISFMMNLTEPWLDIKSVFRALELFVIFYFFGRQKYYEINKWAIFFLLVVIVISEFSFISPVLTGLIESFYPVKENVVVDNYGDIEDVGRYSVRFGGLYRNANDCAFYLNALFVLVLTNKKQIGNLVFLSDCIMIFVGIILTGSRTGFAVIVACLLFHFFNNISRKDLLRLIPIFMIFAVVFIFAGSQFADFRLFQIGSGLNDSLSEKTSLFEDYLNKAPYIHLIFGCFGENATKFITGSGYAGVDNDLGNILIAYGVFFYFVLFGFFVNVYKRISKEYRMLFALLLWSISGSVFLAYRPVALVMLLFGIYYRKSILHKKDHRIIGQMG